MSTQARINPRAVADLDQIWDYIAADDPLAADRFVDAVLATADLAAASPRIGRPRPNLGVGVRSLPQGEYILYFVLPAT